MNKNLKRKIQNIKSLPDLFEEWEKSKWYDDSLYREKDKRDTKPIFVRDGIVNENEWNSLGKDDNSEKKILFILKESYGWQGIDPNIGNKKIDEYRDKLGIDLQSNSIDLAARLCQLREGQIIDEKNPESKCYKKGKNDTLTSKLKYGSTWAGPTWRVIVEWMLGIMDTKKDFLPCRVSIGAPNEWANVVDSSFINEKRVMAYSLFNEIKTSKEKSPKKKIIFEGKWNDETKRIDEKGKYKKIDSLELKRESLRKLLGINKKANKTKEQTLIALGFEKKEEDDNEVNIIDIAEKVIGRIGFINLKKGSGKSQSNNDVIRAELKHECNISFVKKEIALIDPDVILCCGTFDIFKDVLGNSDGWTIEVVNEDVGDVWRITGSELRKDILVLEVPHPQAQINRPLLYYGVCGLYQQALKFL